MNVRSETLKWHGDKVNLVIFISIANYLFNKLVISVTIKLLVDQESANSGQGGAWGGATSLVALSSGLITKIRILPNGYTL